MSDARAADGTVEYHGVNGMGLQVQRDEASGNVVLAVLGPRAGVRGHAELRRRQAEQLAADLIRLTGDPGDPEWFARARRDLVADAARCGESRPKCHMSCYQANYLVPRFHGEVTGDG